MRSKLEGIPIGFVFPPNKCQNITGVLGCVQTSDLQGKGKYLLAPDGNELYVQTAKFITSLTDPVKPGLFYKHTCH